MNSAIVSFESLVPITNQEIQAEDILFDGVHVRVYHPPGREQKLRRAVMFIHGGGWALGAPSMSECYLINHYTLFMINQVAGIPLSYFDIHGIMCELCFHVTAYVPSELGSYDSLCRQMAADLDAVVVTVE